MGTPHTRQTAPSRRLLRCEPLEDRLVLSTFTVTNTNDSGDGSLRQAILDANASVNVGAPDLIQFRIDASGPAVKTISPLSALPPITDPVVIDGYTQPGASPNTLALGSDAVLLVELDGASSGASHGLLVQASDSVIRGLAINQFSQAGIAIEQRASNTAVQGNFIGTDASGTTAAGNSSEGILDGGTGTSIGGQDVSARNVISGNGRSGIQLQGSSAQVRNNVIGTDAKGSLDIGNRAGGIHLFGSRNTVSTNRIAFNDQVMLADGSFEGAGILVRDGIGNAISMNSIFANAGLGIELVNNPITSGADGLPNVNDPGDIDEGPNSLQNSPVLTRVRSVGGNTQIQGTLHSTPNTQFRVELFVNDAADASGTGEGQTALGFQVVTTDAAGNATIDFPNSGLLPLGRWVTATVTSVLGRDTSEFSNAVMNQVFISIGDAVVTEGDGGTQNVVFPITLSQSSDQLIRVAFSSADGSADASDYRPTMGLLSFSPSGGTFGPGETSLSITVQVLGDTLDEPDENYFVNLSAAVNASLEDGQGMGTILNDDRSSRQLLVTGADAGGGPHVKVFDASTSGLIREFYAYDPRFTGGVRVAAGDVNGDGQDDIITAAGPGGGPHVRVFDGRTGAQLPGLIGSFYAYDSRFPGGVYVAAGDVNNDGAADIVTGADAGGGPHVRVFDGRTGAQLPGLIGSFYAYKPDFNAGVRVAAGDVDGDGRADVITGMGASYADDAERTGFRLMGQVDVRVFSGASAALLRSFVPFETGYRGGVHLAVANVNDDLRAEIVVSKANGDARTDAVFNQRHIDRFRRAEVSVFEHAAPGPNRIANFIAYPGFGGSVRVAAIDLVFREIGDQPPFSGPAMLTGAGPGGGPHVKMLASNLTLLDEFYAYDANFGGGLFLAGSPARRIS